MHTPHNFPEMQTMLSTQLKGRMPPSLRQKFTFAGHEYTMKELLPPSAVKRMLKVRLNKQGYSFPGYTWVNKHYCTNDATAWHTTRLLYAIGYPDVGLAFISLISKRRDLPHWSNEDPRVFSDSFYSNAKKRDQLNTKSGASFNAHALVDLLILMDFKKTVPQREIKRIYPNDPCTPYAVGDLEPKGTHRLDK